MPKRKAATTTAERALGRNWYWLQAIGVALVTRLGLALVVWFTTRVIVSLPLYSEQLPDSYFPLHPSLDGWTRWDGAHYVAVASLGYGSDNPSPNGGLGFFPLYPLLMRALVAISGASDVPQSYAVAGLIISNICFFVSVFLLAKLARRDAGDLGGYNSIWLLCLVPFSFFFNAVYSESLFLMLALSAIYLSRDGHWPAAGLVAGLASGTRLIGLALAPALMFSAWRSGQAWWRILLTGVLSCWGTIAYFAWTAWKFDDLLAYFHAQETWGDWHDHVGYYADLFFTNPSDAIGGDPGNLIILLNLVLGVIAVLLLPKVWRTVDPAMAVFTISLVVVQLTFTWVSLGRYLLPAAGLYIAAGALFTKPRWSPLVRDLTFATCAIAMTALAILFSHGFWVV